MIGQDAPIDEVRRVVVLVELRDGRQIGWEVTLPTELSWEYDGMHDIHGTMAKMVVSGVFHRKNRDIVLIVETFDGNLREIEP